MVRLAQRRRKRHARCRRDVKLTIGVKSYAGTGKSNLSNTVLWRAPGSHARKRNRPKVEDVSRFSI